MSANGAVGETRKVERLDLIEIAGRSTGDQPDSAERLVSRAHDFAERGRGDRVVEVLEDDDGGPGSSAKEATCFDRPE